MEYKTGSTSMRGSRGKRGNVTSETIDTELDPNGSRTLSALLRTYPSFSPTTVS